MSFQKLLYDQAPLHLAKLHGYGYRLSATTAIKTLQYFPVYRQFDFWIGTWEVYALNVNMIFENRRRK